jgi:phosphocarrier protein FPr
MDAWVELRNLTTGAGPVPANSLSRVATLAALRGHEIEVRASGPQAHEAVEHVLSLARRRFDEPQAPLRQQGVVAEPTRGPLAASPGIAIGPVCTMTTVPVDLDEDVVGDPAAEWRRVVEAVAAVRREIEHLRVVTARRVGAEEASIFDAHLLLLTDADVLADVKARLGAGVGAVAAWAACLSDVQGRWAALPDAYLRERAEDVRAVSDQVLRALTGQPSSRAAVGGVLVTRDLTPAEAAGLDADLVTGIVLAEGSPTSHAAILARARSIPMVVAAGLDVLALPEGTTVILDGSSGELHADPEPHLLEQFRDRAADLAQRSARHLADAEEPAVSKDGTVLTVVANVGSPADARAALAAGADGAGLVRTEFLFLDRDTAPDLEEQQAEYTAVAEALGGRRVTLRTLDVGGDKPLPYLPMPLEANPFLGRRGIRLSLDHRELLYEQLVAVCRTARQYPTSVMFPMVSTVGELLEARQVLADAAGPEGLPAGLHVGMMVEVPAAALKIETFLPHLDFVSIGTNDLTQYALAAERGNAAVAALSDALDPGVLQLVAHVCRAARGRVDVAVCGEAASDELAVPVLVGLGVRELSVSPQAVPRVKAALRELDLATCAALAEQALDLAGAADVRKLVLGMLSGTSA